MKRPNLLIEGRKLVASKTVVIGVLVVALPVVLFAAAPQTETDVSPEATPEIRQVKPSQVGAGDEITVIIEGKNFSAGAYVSFSTPAMHAIATKRTSATQLEARVAVGKKAEAGTVSLFVSNPASAVAEVPFTIAGGAAPAKAPASAAAEALAPPTPPPAQASSLAPAAAAPQPSTSIPEVTSVDPPRAGKGSQLELKIRGNNFAKGAKVAFSNPGIRVLETQVTKDSELTARMFETSCLRSPRANDSFCGSAPVPGEGGGRKRRRRGRRGGRDRGPRQN